MEPSLDKEEIVVGMADLKIGKAPQIIVTTLGSCVGVCVFFEEARVGGLLHLMMACSGEAISKEN